MLILMGASGCASGGSVPTDTFCLVAPPIYDSPLDTEETQRQVDGYWAVADALGCGWPDYRAAE